MPAADCVRSILIYSLFQSFFIVFFALFGVKLLVLEFVRPSKFEISSEMRGIDVRIWDFPEIWIF